MTCKMVKYGFAMIGLVVPHKKLGGQHLHLLSGLETAVMLG